MRRLYLVRHGTTAWTLEGRYTGRSDPPLNHVGRHEALQMAEFLAAHPIELVLSSPLVRAQETARLIANAHPRRPRIRLESRLAEIDYGGWEGRTRAEILAEDPDAFANWDLDPTLVPPPGGESVASVQGRVLELVAELWESEGEAALLVSHRTVARVLIASLLGIPLPSYRRRLDHAPAALTILELLGPDEARLCCYNLQPKLLCGRARA